MKSYIEAYLAEHGGQIPLPAEKIPQPLATPPSPEQAAAPVVRNPVDVRTTREHMDSLREVATHSVEHALATYSLRREKGRLAWRSVLVAGLVIVIVVTNAAKALRFASLNWLMGAIVVLSVAELCLRLHSIHRQRKEMRLNVLEPQRKSETPEACMVSNEQEC